MQLDTDRKEHENLNGRQWVTVGVRGGPQGENGIRYGNSLLYRHFFYDDAQICMLIPL